MEILEWFWAVLPSQKQIWVFFRNKYGFQKGNAMGKNCFDQEEMLKMARYSIHTGFWMCWFQWHRFGSCIFRCFWVMGYMYALSWKLLIKGLLSEYFANLLKRLYLKKTAAKCSIFLHRLYFFLMGRSFFTNSTLFLWEGQGLFVGIGIKFHLERTKARG